MARLLALDWDHQQVQIVAATPGTPLRVQQAVVWSDMAPLQPADAEALGKQLHERLKSAGIASGHVVACLGRDRVILKEVRYPAGSAADEPALVRFQAAKELTDPVEDVVIDYTPLDGTGPAGERRALALVVKKEVLATYQTLCKAAGLKLQALTPRPFGTMACYTALAAKGLAPVSAETDAVAVLSSGERWAEFTVIRGNTVLFTRAMTPGAGLAGEVRRNLAVYAGQSPQHPLKAVLVAGDDEQAALRQQLQTLSVPVHTLNPFAGTERDQLPATGPGRFTPALGLLYAESSRIPLAINFVQPKQPTVQADPNQRRNVLLVAAAAVLLLGLGVLAWSHLASYDRQIQQLAKEKFDLDQAWNALQPDARKIKNLDDWTKSQVNWLDELYDMTARIPDTDALRLTDLTATAGDPLGKTPQEKSARLTIKGVTGREQRPLDNLRNQLTSETSIHRVSASNLRPNRTGQDRRFSQEFTTSMHIDARLPNKYVRRVDETNGDTGPRRGDSGRRGRSNAVEFAPPEGGRP